MGIGNVFLEGYRSPRPNESYLPMIQELDRQEAIRKSRGIGGPRTIGTGLDEEMRASGGNRTGSTGSIQAPTPTPAPQAPTQRPTYPEAPVDYKYWEMRDKEKTGEVDREVKLREQSRQERETGIRERESKQKIDAGQMAIDNERRIQDHNAMMQAFVMKDPNAIMTWFVKNAPKGTDGTQRIPMIDIGPDGNWMVEWPGTKGPVAMDDQTLGRVLMSLSPKYERPSSPKEEAELELTKRGVGIKGGLGIKDAEELRQKHAKNISDSTALEDNPTSYEDAYGKLGPGLFTQQQPPGTGISGPGDAAGSRQVVRTGRTRDGMKAVQYDDGTIEIVDPATGQRVR